MSEKQITIEALLAITVLILLLALLFGLMTLSRIYIGEWAAFPVGIILALTGIAVEEVYIKFF